MSDGRKCGCKGKRTCLLCEQYNDVSTDHFKSKEVRGVYTYCPHCNLCWPDSEDTSSTGNYPLYLGKIKLCLEFITEEEETAVISAIDKIPWMLSQSGRRKQDFGPKVNFKKKKVKIGEFKGFPRFTESILHKFQEVSELSDFQPVELCHLEYSPERGSSIDPHVDDFWLWGERLVTVNLGSSTVLTLTACSDEACECYQEAKVNSFKPCTLFGGHTSRKFSCNHKFQDIYVVESSMKLMSADDSPSGKNSNIYPEGLSRDSDNSKLFNVGEKDHIVSSIQIPVINASESILRPADQLSQENRKMSVGIDNNSSSLSPKCSVEVPNSQESGETKHAQNNSDFVSLETFPKTVMCDFCSPSCTENVSTMCRVFRTDVSDFKAAVRIVLPPRSLLVLAGCARYNWFHEIKRQDVVSRRLAMTFRELTAEFLDEGKESQLGKDLLLIANRLL